MDQQQTVLAFLRTNLLGVIATFNEQDSQPEAAVVGVSETEQLELIFGTTIETRKYKNLQSNPRIAAVIGWSLDEKITVQYQGVAQELTGEELEQLRAVHIQKNPASQKFAFSPNQRFFKVTPTWIRYSNLGTKPPTIFELTFESKNTRDYSTAP